MALLPPRRPGKPPLPLATRMLASAIGFLTDTCIRRDATVNRRLMDFFDRKVPPNPTPTAGVATSDHQIDPARKLWIRLFSPSPPPATPLPVILYFHGGGFVFHSAATGAYDTFCRLLARHTPAVVVSVDYRLSPEHRFPAPYEDGVDVLRWLEGDEGRRLVPDVQAVFLAGDSAGGNIAHHVARRVAVEAPPPLARAAVAGLVAIQPFFDGEEETGSEAELDGVAYETRERFGRMWRAFLPGGSDRDHEAANVFGSGGSGPGDWFGFPATMVCVGGWDMLQDRQRRYADGLERVGVAVRVVEYPDGIHGFYVFPELAEAGKLIADVGDYVRHVIDALQ